MSAVVWKFRAALAAGVEMPKGARIVEFAFQGHEAFIWAIVDPTAEVERRFFTIIGTGHEAPDGQYVGTAHVAPFVWHLWETPE